MADQWSDHFASSQPGLTRVGQRRVSAGIGHSRLRYKRAAITLDLAPSAFTAADVARIMQFHSNDRLIELFVYSAGDAGTVAVDIGLYKSGQQHDGVVVDVDLFCSALAINAGIARVDEFLEAGLTNNDRGKTLWEMANIGLSASTYSADDNAMWDLCLTATATLDTADEAMVIEAFYTSGD